MGTIEEIKEAVSGQETEDIKKEQNTTSMRKAQKTDKIMGNTTDSDEDQFEGMQPSMLNPSVEELPEQPGQDYYPQSGEQYVAQEPAQYQEQYQAPQDYAQYQPYQQGLSSDTITEISEQIVDEKIQSIKSQMEKVIDFKNTVESKIEYIDERLKRIERIIDRLQLSVLQKVGDYITNVEDIKRELQETQKSFGSLLSRHHQKK